jgi:hypothetical protein
MKDNKFVPVNPRLGADSYDNDMILLALEECGAIIWPLCLGDTTPTPRESR